MPELPEVETIRQQLDKHLPGLELIKIECLDEKVSRFLAKRSIDKIVEQKILAVKRRAKVLLLEFANNYYLAFHLKMTGQVILHSAKIDYLPNKHTRAILHFSQNQKVYFQDMRKFGWLKVIGQGEIEKGLFSQSLGPEPFGKEFTLTYFQKILAKSSRPIKIFLLDQSLIAGIGNIYANEALFLAKIHPQKLARQLYKQEIKELFAQIKKVLQKGIDLGGASDNAYLDAYGGKGKFQEHFLVYGRSKKPCVNCQTAITRIALGGRGTFYCSNCQPISK